jgi:alkylated DNA repair dioxygenase AlkB
LAENTHYSQLLKAYIMTKLPMQTECFNEFNDLIKVEFNYGEELYCVKGFYDLKEANDLFQKLLSGLCWEKEYLFIYGKQVTVPRLLCWHGDPEALYRYSGVNHEPRTWAEDLLAIKLNLEKACGSCFNSVLANLYRDGNDSMGWHADNEKELGNNPVIASLSLGDDRLFKIRHHKSKSSFDINLSHGDLLVMGGSFQHYWQHSVPKTKVLKTPRINLTYRYIMSG